jgi:hypothetical protein
MTARHKLGSARPGRPLKVRHVLFVLAPVFLLLQVTQAGGAVPGPGWSKDWSTAVDLPVNGSTAGFMTLPLSMAVGGSQKATASATFRTNWVDVRARTDGPNIAQQGLSTEPAQFKLQIMHGPAPADHRGNCHIRGTTGHVLAFGPSIDVADGAWHTITCIKYPDSATGTKVVVIVDGVPGQARWSKQPIGRVDPKGLVRLGGRSAKASTDSLDGSIRSLSFRIG